MTLNKDNFLGVFDTLHQLWEQVPEGGREGDYVTVGATELYWDKYKRTWVDKDSQPVSDIDIINAILVTLRADLATVQTSLNTTQSTLSSLRQSGYKFAGVATPDTNPKTANDKIFYLASTPGEYVNFPTGAVAIDPSGLNKPVKYTVGANELVVFIYTPEILSNGLPSTSPWKKLSLPNNGQHQAITIDEINNLL